jgi:hypothetical protein
MGRTALAIAPSDPSVIYALAASNLPGPNDTDPQGLHAVFRSTDGGAPGTWTAQVRNSDPIKLHTLILTNPVSASYADCGFGAPNSYTTMGWYVDTIGVDPVDPTLVWAAGVDWFRSSDGGHTWGVASQWWNETSPSYVHADQHAIVFHPGYNGASNQTVYAAGDGGIFRSDNARARDGRGSRAICDPASPGLQWISLNHGYGVTQFYHGVPVGDAASYVAGAQDNGTIIGNDASGPDGWRSILGGDGGYVAADPGNPGILYAESQWANIRKTTDGGRTFRSASRGLADRTSSGVADASNFLFVTPFLLDPNGAQRLWTGGREIYRSDDGAGVWRVASPALLDEGRVSAIAVFPGDPDLVAVGSTDGRVYVTRSGRAATRLTPWESSRPREGWITSLSFDPADPEALYATYGSFGGAHVFKSGNGGRTWRSMDGTGLSGLPDAPVHAILVDPDRPGRLYLGTDLGVFVSTDGGDAWAVENTGFGAVVTESLSLARGADGDEWLFAFTHGRGAWRVRVR